MQRKVRTYCHCRFLLSLCYVKKYVTIYSLHLLCHKLLLRLLAFCGLAKTRPGKLARIRNTSVSGLVMQITIHGFLSQFSLPRTESHYVARNQTRIEDCTVIYSISHLYENAGFGDVPVSRSPRQRVRRE